MLIPVTLASSSSNPKLPSGLAKISHDEIVLIELQGSLEVELTHPHERNGKFIGKLKIDEATNKPSLLIGHHLLEGKIAPLPKPYAILVRNGPSRGTSESQSQSQSDAAPHSYQEEKGMGTMASGGNDNDNGDGEDDEAMAVDTAQGLESLASAGRSNGGGNKQGSSAGWTISGIVKKKIIFSKRPMPVIGKKL